MKRAAVAQPSRTAWPFLGYQPSIALQGTRSATPAWTAYVQGMGDPLDVVAWRTFRDAYAARKALRAARTAAANRG